MTISEIDKDEIIKAAVTLLAVVGSGEFNNQFPTLDSWCKENVSEEDQNKLVAEMIEQVNQDDTVTIAKDDFFTLYAYVQAVLGFEETKARFPRLRSIALNISDQDQLTSLLQLVKQIETLLHDKYGR